MDSFPKRLIILTFLLTALVACQAPAGASDGLSMDLRIGFDRIAQSGSWIPISAIVENTGPDIEAELRVETTALGGENAVYVHPISLPRGSRMALSFSIGGLSGFENEVQVDLVSQGRVLLSESTSLDVISAESLLVGIWSDTPDGAVSIGAVIPSNGDTALALLTPDDFPEVAEAWTALDVLIIANADTSQLDSDQVAAMQGWLAQGGRLLIAAGTSFQRTLSGLEELSPVLPTGTVEVSLSPLAAFANASFGQAQIEALVASGPLTADAGVLLASDDVPLIVFREVGYGRVDFLAFDLDLQPVAGWDDTPAMWRSILLNGAARPGWAYGLNQNYQFARDAVAAVPGVRLPAALQLCGFLLLYVLLIGPVNYLVLRQMGRLELAWVTIPVLVVLFSLVAYITGFQLRGSRPIVHRLAVVQSVAGDSTAQVDGYFGIWSPRRQTYDVLLDEGLLARPIPREIAGALTAVTTTSIETDQNVTVRDIRVDVGSISAYLVQGTQPNPLSLSVDLSLEPLDEGVRVRGEITNESEADLTETVLLLGGVARPISDLPAGELLLIDEVFQGGQATPGSQGIDPYPQGAGFGFYPYALDSLAAELTGIDNCQFGGALEPLQQRRCNFINSIVVSEGRGSGIYLAGWSEAAPLGLEVLNANVINEDVALHLVQLPALNEVGGGNGLLEIPPGLMTYSVVDVSPNVYSPNPYDLYMNLGEFVSFRFQPAFRYDVDAFDTVVLSMQSYNTNETLPIVEILDVEAGIWVPVNGRWGRTRIDDAGRFIDDLGGVTFRIEVENNFGQSISRFDVSYRSQDS
ncbi:MAG: hypothetical protein GYB68_15890 [Chloroflexi bacterium]|nr:hypothetical protein [Chloroflexota bacterium]